MELIAVRRWLKIVIITLFGFSIMVLVTPLLVPVMMLFWCVSQAFFFGLRIKHGSSVTKPTGMDIVSGKENDVSRPYVNVAFRFTKTNPDVEKIIDRFRKVILDPVDEKGNRLFKKFTQVFETCWGYHVWRDAEGFDLRNHIRMVDPKPFIKKCWEGRQSSNGENRREEQGERMEQDLNGVEWEVILFHFMAEFGAKPVRSGMPKWEFLILPETDNRYTTLFRVHHSISDGLYFVRLLSECLADHPVDVKMPFKASEGNVIKRIMKTIWYFSLLPHTLCKALAYNDTNPLHGPKLTGRKKYFLTQPFSISLLKDIKKVAKVSINDILYSCASSAATKHFTTRNASVENMTVLLAVNQQKKGTPVLLKNNYAVTSLKVPVSENVLSKSSSEVMEWNISSTKPHAYELHKIPSLFRLQIVKNRLYEARSDPCLMSCSWLLTTFSYILPAELAETMLSTQGITMDISNIQGPLNENIIMVDQASAEEILFWLPDRDPLGIGVSILSYIGFIRVGLIVDEALMPKDEEGHLFLNSFTQEVDNLLKEVTYLKKMNDTETEFSSLTAKMIP